MIGPATAFEKALFKCKCFFRNLRKFLKFLKSVMEKKETDYVGIRPAKILL